MSTKWLKLVFFGLFYWLLVNHNIKTYGMWHIDVTVIVRTDTINFLLVSSHITLKVSFQTKSSKSVKIVHWKWIFLWKEISRWKKKNTGANFEHRNLTQISRLDISFFSIAATMFLIPRKLVLVFFHFGSVLHFSNLYIYYGVPTCGGG